MLVVDSAHNADSAQKLRAALAEWFPRPPRRQLALVFGASADKDIDGMLESFLGPQIATGATRPPDKVIVTQERPSALGRSGAAGRPGAAGQHRPARSACSDPSTAPLTDALAWAGPDDLICVTGSIFVVAQARRAWATRHPEAFAPDDWVFQDETAGEIVPDDEEKRDRRWIVESSTDLRCSLDGNVVGATESEVGSRDRVRTLAVC